MILTLTRRSIINDDDDDGDGGDDGGAGDDDDDDDDDEDSDDDDDDDLTHVSLSTIFQTPLFLILLLGVHRRTFVLRVLETVKSRSLLSLLARKIGAEMAKTTKMLLVLMVVLRMTMTMMMMTQELMILMMIGSVMMMMMTVILKHRSPGRVQCVHLDAVKKQAPAVNKAIKLEIRFQ